MLINSQLYDRYVILEVKMVYANCPMGTNIFSFYGFLNSLLLILLIGVLVYFIIQHANKKEKKR